MTALPHTQEDILAKIEEVASDDWLGTQREDLMIALDYQHMRPFLKEGVTEDEWGQRFVTVEDVKNHAKDYLVFAMGKADNHRGISAGRSIDHFRTWAWLTGDAAFIKAVEDADYPNYGAPILKAVAVALDAKDVWDANTTPELERMALGQACDPNGCYDGCNA